MSEQLLHRFWVFDPDRQAGERFRTLLGPGAAARFEYVGYRFEDEGGIVTEIGEALGTVETGAP